jgi:hypothetical protein
MEVHWDTRGLYVSTPLCGAFCEVGTRSAFVVDLMRSALPHFVVFSSFAAAASCSCGCTVGYCGLLWAAFGCALQR